MATRMTYAKWEETYKPVRHTKSNDGFGGIVFDGLHGEKKLPKYKHLLDNPKCVWSFIVDQDNGRGYIMPGFIRCDRFGIFLCEVPFEDEKTALPVSLGRM